MKYYLYSDESGEISFSENTTCDYFVICVLAIDENKINKVKNTLKKKKAKLYKLGWPKVLEIKPSILVGLKNRGDIPKSVKQSIDGVSFIQDVLTSMKNSFNPEVNYIVVRKEGITDASFRNAAYGIAYNYFAGKILIPVITKHKDCLLTVDKRNKETHPQKYFDGYLETKIIEAICEKGVNISLQIKHDDSFVNFGLQAVDYFSWSIYRKYANKDERYFVIFEDLVDIKNEWCF
ncbi:MAG: hypothetical protein A2231_06425 [Candidatus Firestonebacteria bacterium RIFOXYA2_FULL_40_8]|nr:MAG: hypothetical protein A2231_06425 [Candidatus Firestonebacteria bacterium RIFOXYA2_FULL_40_8]